MKEISYRPRPAALARRPFMPAGMKEMKEISYRQLRGLGQGIDISHYGAPYQGMLGVGDGLGSYTESPGFDYEYATAGMGEYTERPGFDYEYAAAGLGRGMLYRYGAALGAVPWTGAPAEDPRMVKKFTTITSSYRVRNLGGDRTAEKAAQAILAAARQKFSGNTVRLIGTTGWTSGGKVGFQVILAQDTRAGEIKQKNFQAGKKAQSTMGGNVTFYDATTSIPSTAFVDAPPGTPPTPEETPSTTPDQDVAETSFFSKKVAGVPMWAVTLIGGGLVVGVGYMALKPKKRAPVPNRRRKRRRRRTSRRR